MKKLIAALCFMMATSPLALAQNRGEDAGGAPAATKLAQAKTEPSAKQKAQRQRMKDCSEKAKGKTGDARKKFMSACLKNKA